MFCRYQVYYSWPALVPALVSNYLLSWSLPWPREEACDVVSIEMVWGGGGCCDTVISLYYNHNHWRCGPQLFVWHTSHLMSLQIGRLYLISSIWLHRSFIKSSITNKMQILRKLQLMTAGCLFCHNSKSCVDFEVIVCLHHHCPGHHHHYSVLSLQCTWDTCSRPRLLDREAPGKNIWCAVKLSSTRYWPVGLAWLSWPMVTIPCIIACSWASHIHPSWHDAIRVST